MKYLGINIQKYVKKNKTIRYIFALTVLLSVFSCDSLLDVDTPQNIVVDRNVWSNAQTLRTAVNGLYTRNLLSNTLYYYALPFYLTVITDDAYHTSTSYDDLRYNAYTPTNTYTAYFWSYPYQSIFLSNDLITNLSSTSLIEENEKQHYIGEAKYFRAYSYFILSSLFGDVPLIESTKIMETTLQPRVAKETIVQFIIQDLKDVEIALSDSDNPKTKVTKAAASALLARNYLYHEEWKNAEDKANEVITTSGYVLEESLDNVFLRSSKESIFQTSSSGTWSSYIDRVYFANLAVNKSYLLITDDFANSFEAGDLRKTKWFTTVSSVLHPYKYKRTASSSAGAAEDFVSLRLAEQYLIRAEARAQQGKLTGADGALADLNAIRKRAGLPNLSETLTKAQVLLQVEKERRSELFTEEIHRWWDLVRTGRVDAVLGAFPDKKWVSYRALFPVPEIELNKNKNLTQNPGYGTIK